MGGTDEPARRTTRRRRTPPPQRPAATAPAAGRAGHPAPGSSPGHVAPPGSGASVVEVTQTDVSRPPGWSDRDLSALAAAFETFVPGASIRRAHLAAAALNAVAAPTSLRLLRLVLRSLDSRVANFLLGAGFVRFRDLPAQRRERLLLRWATSRFAQRRTAYQTLKRLGCFLAYADPGPTGTNPLWARIGYRSADEPVTPEPPAVVPLDPAILGSWGARVTLEADVVVVGSGAGGGVVAAALAAAGRAVVVVEAGSYVPETAMTGRELDGFDRLYLDHGMTATTDLGVAILAGATLGGGTTVNWTTCLPPPDWLRAEWCERAGLDGFDGADTVADVAALEAELGFAPPPMIPPKDQAILDGAAALGWDAQPPRRDAVGCGDCGSCGFGCRRAAKRSGPRAHLATAAAHGARFLVDAPVERILLQDGRAVGVTGRLAPSAAAPGGEAAAALRGPVAYTIRARQVVLAAGALRTPVLLLRSGLHHPATGKFLHLHPVPVVAARLPGLVEMWRGTMQGAGSLQFARPGPAADGGTGPAHGGFIIESAPAHPGLVALGFPWEGAAHQRAVMERARSLAPFIGIVRDRGWGTVRPGRGTGARIDYGIAPEDAQTARRALVEMARLARAAGAAEILAVGTPGAWYEPAVAADRVTSSAAAGWSAYLARLSTFDFRPNRGFLFSAHQMGTARAGADPRLHACDPWGRVRGGVDGTVIGGLYVADASLFPTASGVNPMVTVMVLARRVARTVLGDA